MRMRLSVRIFVHNINVHVHVPVRIIRIGASIISTDTFLRVPYSKSSRKYPQP